MTRLCLLMQTGVRKRSELTSSSPSVYDCRLRGKAASLYCHFAKKYEPCLGVMKSMIRYSGVNFSSVVS
jgi:hypothetical protein